MKILSAQFVSGVVGEKDIMYDGTPHIAFIGRSNVGKSTTINAILGRKKLVKTGRTPGKTREINFFRVSTDTYEDVYFVDLPGYGYAKLSKNERLKLENLIQWYITHPTSDMALVVLIIDAKAGLTSFDTTMIDLMHQHQRNFILVVNKVDKINQKSLHQIKKEIQEIIPDTQTGENIFYISAFKGKNVHLLRKALFGGLHKKEE